MSDHPKDASQKAILGFNYGNGRGGLGSSYATTRISSFPSSPLFKDEVPGWLQYRNRVMRGDGDIVSSGQDFQFTTADGVTPSKTYVENNPPAFADVKAGSRGKPGSPWTPNTASPKGESTNYSDLPNPPIKITAEDAVANYGTGPGGTRDPKDASAVQIAVREYNMGKWD